MQKPIKPDYPTSYIKSHEVIINQPVQNLIEALQDWPQANYPQVFFQHGNSYLRIYDYTEADRIRYEQECKKYAVKLKEYKHQKLLWDKHQAEEKLNKLNRRLKNATAN